MNDKVFGFLIGIPLTAALQKLAIRNDCPKRSLKIVGGDIREMFQIPIGAR